MNLSFYIAKRYLFSKKRTNLITIISAISVAGMAIGLIFFFSIVFAAFALAYTAGEWFGSLPLGFLAVAGLYFLLGLLVWKLREQLFRIPIMNNLIHQIFDHEPENTKN